MADKEPAQNPPLIYHPTVDHGDLDRPEPTYGKVPRIPGTNTPKGSKGKPA